ncbi:MAG: riboflavin synthase [Armatimonadetes bacterium]|nr:riboflavin synthase [Armatimonadota bacterium]MDE2206451.1 riboflavin synthase [Armatimonadota bacterium]
MFTGIVEECGTFVSRDMPGDSGGLTIGASAQLASAAIGESIAVNGCCLTVVRSGPNWLEFDVMAQTLSLTNLGDLAPGAAVNLERAAMLGDRLGGHLLQGHVDGVGIIVSRSEKGNALVVQVALPAPLPRYVVEHGSIAINGVSLTVAAVDETAVSIWLIPHTREVTNLGQCRVGDRVNIECDVIARYVERLMRFDGGAVK